MYIFQDDEENSQDISLSRSIHITEAHDNQCLRSREGKFLGQLVEEVTSYNADEPDELMALANDVTAAETANLLLPEEHQANFVDFDEFNICLNNILNDDVDADPELSPSMIAETMSPTDVDQMFKVNTVNHKSNTTTTTTTTPIPLPTDGGNVINSSSSSHSSSELSTDILNMVQFEHIEFNFESELGHAAATSSSSTNKMHFENGGYNFMAEESVGLNLADTASCNSTATVSASVTTTASNNDDDTQTALNVIKRNSSHSIVNIFQ